MQQWEYKIWYSGEFTSARQVLPLETELNRLGADGWELIAVLRRNGGNRATAFLKRPKSDG